MGKIKKSQIIVLCFLAIILFVTPLISSSSRPKYLYFIINLLIIGLGVEAGLLSSFSKPNWDDKKHALASPVPKKPETTSSFASSSPAPPHAATHDHEAGTEKKVKRVAEKSASEKIVGSVKMERKVKKCPSSPSLFFIGSVEAEVEDFVVKYVFEQDEEEEEEEEEEIGEISGQELFNKAENFIGNFYKQLKMQREESWKKIHGFYQKAF